MLKTYDRVSPNNIRMGDIVSAYDGEFTANSDAELDQWGDWNVLDENGRYHAYPPQTLVNVTFDEADEY